MISLLKKSSKKRSTKWRKSTAKSRKKSTSRKRPTAAQKRARAAFVKKYAKKGRKK